MNQTNYQFKCNEFTYLLLIFVLKWNEKIGKMLIRKHKPNYYWSVELFQGLFMWLSYESLKFLLKRCIREMVINPVEYKYTEIINFNETSPQNNPTVQVWVCKKAHIFLTDTRSHILIHVNQTSSYLLLLLLHLYDECFIIKKV